MNTQNAGSQTISTKPKRSSRVDASLGHYEESGKADEERLMQAKLDSGALWERADCRGSREPLEVLRMAYLACGPVHGMNTSI